MSLRSRRIRVGAEKRQGVVNVGRRMLQRVGSPMWALVQATAAATTAWILAKHVVGNHEPFFAPIAAVLALNMPLGERGRDAIRLLLGVITGIVTAEITVAVLGGGYGRLALATFGSMAAMRALGGTRLAINQAASSAILTVAVANGEAGTNRLVDALIGAAVALMFTQVLFSPNPVRLLRRAESAALAGMAEGLELTASALERDDDELGREAITKLRDLRDRLVELARLRRVGPRIARHSLIWWTRSAPVVRENENAGHLDLLDHSCLTLARLAVALDSDDRGALAPTVRQMAEILAAVAAQPGDRAARQDAANRSVEVLRRPTDAYDTSNAAVAVADTAVRMVAADTLAFAGAGTNPSEPPDAS